MIYGNDISAWNRDDNTTNGDVDFFKMMSAGGRYCFFRAFFALAQDVDFTFYWQHAKEAGLPRGAYYFPLKQYDIVKQTQKFIDLLKPDKGELPPVIDIEVYKGEVPTGIQIKTAIKMIFTQLGVQPIIYTGFYSWRDGVVGSNDPYFAKCDLWIANYNNRPLKPSDIPAPWTTWKFWQFGEGKSKGLAHGVESLDIDEDWFNGSETEFQAYLTGEIIPPVPPDPPPVDTEFILTTNMEMNVRSEPRLTATRVGTIPAGSTIKPINFGGTSVWGNDSWAQLPSGDWACIKRGDTTYFR
jgi:GH25 family lysozyme M1 (1,4-beta-N-acetylmuramidase)